ncbi:MAG: PAS domain S-box protein [Candidatus Heimdallarchaeota archaeon]|nr:PAS domain S-box protein [Candidatus Heimdallarchaeota archaeon]
MSEEGLGEVFNKTNIGISIVKDDKIIHANQFFLEIIDREIDEVLGKNCTFYAAKDEKNRLKKIKTTIEEASLSSPQKIEFWIDLKDDKRKYIRNTLYPVKEEKNSNRYFIITEDITRIKQRETKLLASEFKKSMFLDFLTEHIIFYDTDLKIIWSNKIASDLLGQTSNEIMGEICYKLWYQSDIPCNNCPVVKALNTGVEHSAEVITPDNKIWFIRGYPVFSDDGVLIGAVELATDITDTKLTSDELQVSEERFKQIFHNTNDGMVVVRRDTDGTFDEIMEVNDIALEMYGYTRDEISDLKPSNFNMSGEEETTEFAQELLEKKKLTFERHHITKKGDELFVEISAHLFELGDDTVSLTVVRDITERKRENAELVASEEKFRQIFENAADSILIYPITEDNKLGKFIEVNENACKWTGYTREELLMMTPQELQSPEETIGQSDIGKSLLQFGEVTFEGFLIHKDGSKKPVEYNLNVFTLRGEKVILALARDMSERKRAQKEVELSEERFRQIFHNTNDAIFLSHLTSENESSQFVEVNDASIRWLGFERNELLTMSSIDITAPEERETNPEIISRIIDKGFATFETMLFSKDKKRIPVEISSHIFKLEDKQVILSIARDITERKRARRDLQESEEKYRRLVDTIPAAIISSDSNGNITFVNLEAVEIHGYNSEDEILGKKTNDLVSDEDKGFASIIMQKCIEDGFVHDVEYNIKRRDGTTLPAEFHAAAIKSTEGSITGFIGVVIDIAERKEAEEALKESEEKFRQIFQNAKDAIFIHSITKDGDIDNLLEINETACLWLEYSREELLESEVANQGVLDLHFLLEMKDNILDVGSVTFESRIQNKSGSIKPVEFSSHLFTLNNEQVLLSIARDITEQKKAEDSIKASEERYRTLVETSPDAIVLVDTDYKIQFANPQTAQMFEYDDVDSMIDLTPIDIIVREDLEDAFSTISDIINQKYSQIINLNALKKGGTRFPVKVNASYVADEEGKTLGVIAVIEDITERAKAELALKESEEKFRQTFDLSNDGIMLHDVKGNIIDVNQRAKDLLGYSKTEFLSLRIAQLHPVTEHEASKDAFEEVQDKGSVQFETVFRRKDGSQFPADVSSSFFEVGGIPVIQGIVRDITERKKAEQELVESEEKFRQLFNNANDAIFLTRVDKATKTTGNFIEVNDVACKLMEYSREELLDKKSLDITAPEDRDALAGSIEQFIKSGSATFESFQVTKSGVRIPTEISSHIFKLRDETVALSVLRDITERKQAEALLKESEERYRQLFHNANDIIAVISVPRDGTIGKFVEVNQVALTKTGYGQVEITKLQLDQVIKDIKIEEIKAYFKEMFEKDFITFERELQRKDGTNFPVEINATPFMLKGEISVLVTARDITERKRDEVLRNQAYSQIAQNIEDFAELVDRIRNPLMGVMGYAELSESMHSEVIIEEAKKIEEITKKISESYLETEQVRKIIKEQIDLIGDNNNSDQQNGESKEE